MKTTLLNGRLMTGCLIGLSSLLTQVANAQITAPSANLTMQLRADGAGVTAPGGVVTSWAEEGGGTTFSAAVGQEPTLTTANTGNGSHSVLQFNGATEGDILRAAANVPFTDFVSATSGAIFLVARSTGGVGPDQVGQTAFAWGGGAGFPDRLFAQTQFPVGGGMHFQYGTPPSEVASAVSFSDGAWHILSLLRDGASGTIRLDGIAIATGTFGDAGGLTGAVDSPARVGGAFTTAGSSEDRWNGAIAEILTYDSGTVTLTGAGGVETYLQNKYFTPIPEPSQYAVVFSLACIGAALWRRSRRQQMA